MQGVPPSCAILCPFFPLAKVGLFENFLVAHQVAGDGEEVDVYLNLVGDKECVGGMGSSLVDVVPFRDRQIEEGRLGECLLHGALNEAILTRQFGSVKPQGRVRGVLSIAMADLPFILGKMGVSKCGKTNVLSLGL
jgi:hypothetical protein